MLLLCLKQFQMMMKNYDQSIEINLYSNWPYILTILIESSLLVVQELGKLICY